MAASIFLFDGNDNIIEVDNVRDADGAYDTGATVQVTLTEPDGTELTGVTFPLSLSHVAESPENGKYRATVSKNLVMTLNREYRALIEVTLTGGQYGKKTVTVQPKRRGIHD